MSTPEPMENPFGDPEKLMSRAFPDAMDGTAPSTGDSGTVTLAPEPLTEEGIHAELRDVNRNVLEEMSALKAQQLAVKEALEQGVEFGVPKWVQKLAIKVQAMEDSQRAEFWLSLDRATKAIGVGNPQQSLF